MDLKTILDRRKLAFTGVFALLSLALYQVKFSDILGVQSQSFTLFQLIGPIGAGVLGSALGAVSVFAVEVLNFLIGGQPLDLITFVRFFPMVFAALYFGSRSKITDKLAAIPALVCMLLFWMHPAGAQAWYYALYWLIPIGAVFYKKNILARSLGSTFTAHAIGSVAFLYAFNLPAEVWIALIPIVAVERLTFTAGITLFHYAANTAMDFAAVKRGWKFLNVEKKYSLLNALSKE
ncbi:MAG: hypothetical protein PHS02_01525 [Candidatus ainarchaeum sp.]|nr:hypothetical protein [Candidatus ainarchaeum sp.]